MATTSTILDPRHTAAVRSDRVASRVAWLIDAGKLEPRDLKQFVPPARITACRVPETDALPLLSPADRGDRFGSWIVDRVVWQGRFGVVHRARHAVRNWHAAVKLHATASEIDITRSFDHPNIVRVLDAGTDWMAMPWARGGGLDRRLRTGRAYSVPAVIRIARSMAKALHAVHARGFLHGDVKPANILRADRAVWFADFGHAEPIGHSPQQRHRIVGSWGYLAPERFQGPGDHRSDYYSLGLTLVHLLTGQPPIVAHNYHESMSAHASLAREPLHWTVPGVSRTFAQWILRFIARHPDDRPQSLHEFTHDLRSEETNHVRYQ
jgi:serine/threonine protein kinase